MGKSFMQLRACNCVHGSSEQKRHARLGLAAQGTCLLGWGRMLGPAGLERAVVYASVLARAP